MGQVAPDSNDLLVEIIGHDLTSRPLLSTRLVCQFRDFGPAEIVSPSFLVIWDVVPLGKVFYLEWIVE